MTQDYPYNGRLSRWEEIAPGLAIVGVEALESPFPFEPGQYATLGLMGPAGKLIQRPMSISSSADDLSEYEFFIRRVEGGALTPLLWERAVGDPINIKGAKGKFLLQDDGHRALFVASGTGLAPFMSMIETLRGRGQTRDVVLLHGVSYDYDLAWREQLTELERGGGFPLRYVGTVSRPQRCPDWTGCTGRVEAIVADQLDEHGMTPENATIYLCGNPDMITAVEEIATERGFPAEQVRKELYWPKGRSH
ncbi:MAG TPA: FAD-binding oxidoreductase [Candidatus Limnocylindrales bacterium]|jgi:ferredoxin/flavodoxin---NADP+ reductase|nr:FAD-binding oxidoreductase [Candidatus Limnocylindrales bacterium]